MAKAAEIKPRKFTDPDATLPTPALKDAGPPLFPSEVGPAAPAPKRGRRKEAAPPIKGPGSRGGKPPASSREGRRQIAYWADEATWEAVSVLAVRRRMSIQKLMEEAVSALLVGSKTKG